MCIIVNKPANFAIPTEWFNEFWRKNSDGFGVVWHEGNEAQVYRTLSKEDARTFLSTLDDTAAIVHFRMGTHGAMTLDMCHPFEVMPGIYLTHNGVITAPEAGRGKSDTWSLVHNVVKPLLEGAINPHETIRSDAFRFMLEELCGSSNRIVISDQNGHVLFNTGIWHHKKGGSLDGIWLSNTYAWTDIDKYPTVHDFRRTTRWSDEDDRDWLQDLDRGFNRRFPALPPPANDPADEALTFIETHADSSYFEFLRAVDETDFDVVVDALYTLIQGAA